VHEENDSCKTGKREISCLMHFMNSSLRLLGLGTENVLEDITSKGTNNPVGVEGV
jgi:hypothetical protein